MDRPTVYIWTHLYLVVLYWAYHLRAILIGVVKQEVKRSAGKSGFMGKISFAWHAASWIQSLKLGGGGITPVKLLLFCVAI